MNDKHAPLAPLALVLFIIGFSVFAYSALREDLQSDVKRLTNLVAQKDIAPIPMAPESAMSNSTTERRFVSDYDGFSLTYPLGYQQFAEVEGKFRQIDIGVNEKTRAVEYKDWLQAMASWEAKPLTKNAYPDFIINVFSLDDYRFVNVPGGVEIRYDGDNFGWLRRSIGTEWQGFVPPQVMIGGQPLAYRLHAGDAGHLLDVIAVPDVATGKMIELEFYSHQSTNNVDVPDYIASSFQIE